MRQTSLTTSYLYKASNHDLIPLLHVGHITLHYNQILHMTHVQHVPNIYPHDTHQVLIMHPHSTCTCHRCLLPRSKVMHCSLEHPRLSQNKGCLSSHHDVTGLLKPSPLTQARPLSLITWLGHRTACSPMDKHLDTTSHLSPTRKAQASLHQGQPLTPMATYVAH